MAAILGPIPHQLQAQGENIMPTHAKHLFLLLALITFAGPGAHAAGGGDDGSTAASAGPSEDPDYVAGKQAVAAMNWQAALESFNKAAEKDPKSANAQNYLGYTYRKMGQFDLAFKHYEAALQLNPRHRGAHEYLGEAYLMVGNLPKAEEQLKELDQLCFFPCEEYTELKNAVAEYKQKNAQR
jgi:tetratricopeptide (TPR) repeat protein